MEAVNNSYENVVRELKVNSVNNLVNSDTYTDKLAGVFFRSLGGENIHFTAKIANATAKNTTEAILMCAHGVIMDDDPLLAGIVINREYWPRDNYADGEKELFFDKDGNPKTISEVILRYGKFKAVDALTGKEREVIAKTPKWIAALIDGKWVSLTGTNRAEERFGNARPSLEELATEFEQPKEEEPVIEEEPAKDEPAE